MKRKQTVAGITMTQIGVAQTYSCELCGHPGFVLTDGGQHVLCGKCIVGAALVALDRMKHGGAPEEPVT